MRGHWRNNAPVAESLGVPKSPNSVASTFLNTVHLLPKDLGFERGDASQKTLGSNVITQKPVVFPRSVKSNLTVLKGYSHNRKHVRRPVLFWWWAAVGSMIIARCSAVAAQLLPPKCLQEPPNGDLYKKGFDIMLHLEAEWPSNQNILIADTILAEPRPVARF